MAIPNRGVKKIVYGSGAAYSRMKRGIYMEVTRFFAYLGVMAGVTYLIRAVPLVLCKGKVENPFVRSFLAYVPFAVLGAMTFPAIIYSTGGLISGIAGTIVALFLAFRRGSLLKVAVGACVAAFIAELALQVVTVLS